MNLKDRLDSIRKTNVISIKEDNDKDFLFDVKDVFADSEELRAIITETIASGKNILFVSEPSIDKALVAKYFSFLLLHRLEDVVISENLTNEVLYSDSRTNIIPSPNIKEIVKILEYIMYGYKSFVFGMNFATLDNVLNKLKAAIAINYNGVSQDAIETILSSSNLVLVYLNKNIDGLFYISKIDKVVSENFVTELVTIIDFQQQKPITKKNKKFKKTFKSKLIAAKDVSENIEEDIDEAEQPKQEDIIVKEEKTFEITETIQENVLEQNLEVLEENVSDAELETQVNEELPAVDEKQEQIVEERDGIEENLSSDVIGEQSFIPEKSEEVIYQEQKDIIAEITKKVNKYKLLKEKAKNKKVDITE